MNNYRSYNKAMEKKKTFRYSLISRPLPPVSNDTQRTNHHMPGFGWYVNSAFCCCTLTVPSGSCWATTRNPLSCRHLLSKQNHSTIFSHDNECKFFRSSKFPNDIIFALETAEWMKINALMNDVGHCHHSINYTVFEFHMLDRIAPCARPTEWKKRNLRKGEWTDDGRLDEWVKVALQLNARRDFWSVDQCWRNDGQW